LLQTVLAFDGLCVLEQGIGIDHVARGKHLGHQRRRLATPRRRRGALPPDAVKCDQAGFALLADRAAEFVAGLKANPHGLIAGFQDHCHAPGRDIQQRPELGKLDAPITGNIEMADRSAIALLLVIANEASHHGPARHHLELGVEPGAHR